MGVMYKNLSDEDLVAKIIDGNKEMYAVVVDRYQERLTRYSEYLISDKAKAADAVQETFIKAYVNLRSFDQRLRFSSWIYRIAHNESINLAKKYAKELSVTQHDLDLDIREHEFSIEKDYDEKEQKLAVAGCLKDLPDKYKDVITLYYLEEKSYEEISDILKMPIGTVGVRIKRGKEHLKKLCQKQITMN